MILREAVERQKLLIKALKRRKRKVIKTLIKQNVHKHQDGRQLYELNLKELTSLSKEQR